MKQYETYRPSGIEWLGEIPEHWEVKRVKDLFLHINDSSANLKEGTYVPLENIESFTGRLIKRVSNENGEDTTLFKTGDILLNKLRPYLAKVLLAEFDGGVSGEVIVYRTLNKNKKRINSKYYFYRFLSQGFISKINSITDGVKMPRSNPNKIFALDIQSPLYNEQTAIANYLDTKTAAIDRKIELLIAKADKYKSLRRSLINETVCRGLPASERFTPSETLTKMKDSGIEWIGKIPEHWEVKRFKSIANTVKGRNLELSDTYFENSLPNLSLEYLRNESVTFDTYCYTPDKNQRVTTDDMIIIWDGAGVGEILKGKEGFLSSTIAKIVVDKKKYNSKFLYHLRFSIEYILKMIPAGMGIPHLNPQVLNSFNCPCPPIDEQTEIAEYLNEKTTHIDTILANINEQINKLTQLRKTLINDVVTGKIKVTD